MLSHGWPGSVAEFSHAIDELADPSDTHAPAFHVVAPSIPWFGFSDKPTDTGWGVERISAAWVSLMGRLGYAQFAAHGGDWGGVTTTVLGGQHPEHILGIHSTLTQAPPGMTTDGLSPLERNWAEETRSFWLHSAERCRQIVRWATPATGGHFPSLDVPEAFVADLREGLAAALTTRPRHS